MSVYPPGGLLALPPPLYNGTHWGHSHHPFLPEASDNVDVYGGRRVQYNLTPLTFFFFLSFILSSLILPLRYDNHSLFMCCLVSFFIYLSIHYLLSIFHDFLYRSIPLSTFRYLSSNVLSSHFLSCLFLCYLFKC